jgi:hypothetical protein
MLRGQTIDFWFKKTLQAKGGRATSFSYRKRARRGDRRMASCLAHCDRQVKHGIRTLINPNPASADALTSLVPPPAIAALVLVQSL